MLLTSPPRHIDQGDAIDAAAQHEIAVGGWHHVAHDSSARRDRPSLESFSLSVEAHEDIRILPRFAVPYDVIQRGNSVRSGLGSSRRRPLFDCVSLWIKPSQRAAGVV